MLEMMGWEDGWWKSIEAVTQVRSRENVRQRRVPSTMATLRERLMRPWHTLVGHVSDLHQVHIVGRPVADLVPR